MFKSEQLKWAFFFAFLLTCLIMYYFKVKADNRIKKNHVIVCGRIIRISSGRGGWLIDYEYYVNNQRIQPNESCTTDTKIKFENGDNRILVVYERDNIYNAEILENREGFIKYQVTEKDTAGLNCN